ncbi:MAG: hypothetical protein IH620_07855 [Ignavibacterium sp.]|nr:hypothetical protein [Ignavibacterium sp.]
MRYYRIDALPFNTKIKIVLDCPFGTYHGFCPSIFIICRIGDNLVEVTPVDYLNTLVNRKTVSGNDVPEPVKKVIELIEVTKKTVKEYSTTEPSFDSDQMCKYSITLTGKTVEEIFHKLNRMYFDIINQTSMDYSTLRKFYSVRKGSNK